jgi:branched-chain amino acid transport system substrate-binding protein
MKHDTGAGFLLIASCAFTIFASIIFFPVSPSFSAEKPYRLGAILSVTGPASSLGDPMKKTVLLLQKKINRAGGINGHSVEIIIYDDECQENKAVLAINRLIKNDKVCAIVGPTLTGPTLAVIPIAEKNRIPIFSGGSSEQIVQPLKKFTFKAVPSEGEVITKLINVFLIPKKIKKVAIIYESTAYGQSGLRQLKERSPQYGIKIVAEETYGQKDNDMSAQLVRIKNTDAEALVVWGTTPGPAIIAKNAYELKMEVPIIHSWGSVSQRFLNLAGKYAEGHHLVATRMAIAPYLPDSNPGKAVTLQYMQEYEAEYKEPANTYGGNAWVAFQMYTMALKAVGDNPVKISDYLETIRNFEGPPGKYSLSPTDHMGMGWEGLAAVQVKNGKFVPYEK